MTKFYNPYQFIPVTGTVNDKKPRVPIAPILEGSSESHPWVRHDLWHASALSGRIVCSCYLATPTAVGARQVKSEGIDSKLVEPYTIDGQPALPGNSLKGMISAVAEALSQSTLRVLESHKRPRSTNDLAYRVSVPGDPRGRKVLLETSIHDMFEQRIDQDMIPWMRREGSRERTTLTPAELLFGVVEEVEPDVSANPSDNRPDANREGRNLGGRLRFHDAISERPVRLYGGPPHTLKILNSPKLPCPSMYFHRRSEPDEIALTKDLFHDKPFDDDIVPNGRKVYLHHHQDRSAIANQSWRTRVRDAQATERLKLRASPMQSDQTLFFHVDFNNLAPAELTLLEHALAPSPQFRHRLGLGKPLGLGSVVVGIEGVFLIDRARRYDRDAFDTEDRRYHRCWRPTISPDEPRRERDWSAEYPIEWAFLNGNPPPLKTEADNDMSLIDRATLDIVRTVGDPSRMVQSYEVRTPYLEQQEDDPERETFRWFNENDERGGQALPRIKPNEKLPGLFCDPEEALRYRHWQQSQEPTHPASVEAPPEVRDWLADHVRDVGQYSKKPTAELVVALEDDPALQAAVFEYLCKHCATHGFFVRQADKLYREHGLIPVYE